MPASPPFTLLTAPCGPDTQVIIRGELDLTAAPELARALACLRDSARGGLVLHLGGVEFIDCACARVIAQAVQAWPCGPTVICDPSPAVRRLFHLTGLAAAAGIAEPGTPPRRARIPAVGRETGPAAAAAAAAAR